MEIQVDNSDDDEEFHVLDEVKRFSDVTFNHLREVKLVNITRTRPQMKLIELLLAKSPALERFLIEPRPGNESLDIVVEILAELTKFQRASPKAQVVYDYDKNRWYSR
ncbi:uncharacterized protein [Nicotiana tomentosiformis]|uniref:uncharacterized protein n=1 Tax=Nicotiana tomentosiformis TaxID=4098 RepID=UPI00388C649A